MAEFDIAFPEERRFDDRRLRSEDAGRDFERFVYEALSLLIDADTLRPGFGPGRDGAIDHMVDDAGQRTVVECKFIGRNAGSSPQARWGEVRRHLNDNLPDLAAKTPADRGGSPYRPWLDPEHRISGYLFCVSYAFAHAEERAALERQIASDFLKLSSRDPLLSYLAGIHVQVRGWDDFHGELRRRFPLRYRWFGDLPRGIAPIRDERFESRSFRRFLFEDSLPFFSREQYFAESAGRQITREEEFVSGLSAERGDEALILTGAGGVGKTRLGLELCDRLSKQGWLALRATDSATSASVSELVKAHVNPAQIVLLLDYAEKADDLSAIADELALINDGNAHRVRIVATCRISAFSGVQDTLAPLQPRAITLGTPRASDVSEIAFTEWVVDQILTFGRIPQPKQVARVCHGLPILASFALFLYERDAAQFSEQFGDLGGIKDFRDWVKRRLDIALRVRRTGLDERAALQRLALLALRLPMTRREADDLADRSSLEASLLEMMRTDHWIEDEDDGVIATHDVFADAMAAHYIFETRAVATTRLAELLRAATEQDFLARAFIAIDRLASHPDFDAVDGTAALRGLMARSPTRVIAAHERLLRGRFLPDRGKIELLAEYPDLHAAISKNRDCDIQLSHIADNLARLRRRDPADASFVEWASDVIAPLLAVSLATPHPSNMLLRRAFALLPETYRSMVRTRIAAEPTAIQTHYLLVSWLYGAPPIDDVAPATETWLSANAHRSLKTSFVVRAWLDAGGQRDLIDRHVLAWIDAFGVNEVARFVYKAWLDAGGRRDRIDHHVLAWIETFGTTVNAKFVYTAWLDAGGQRDLIDRHVLAWIEAFGVTEDAQFMYKSWINAGGRRDLIDRQVLAWIEAFGALESATFVYTAWIEAGGQRDLVDRHVLGWIEAFGATKAATFVYTAWLDAGGQRDLVDRHVLAWIDAFGATEAADFIYRAWLGAGGDFEAISKPCLAWFYSHAASYKSSFIMKYISQRTELPSEGLHAAIRWCILFVERDEAVWRAAALLTHHFGSPETVALVRAFLACVRFLNLDRLSPRRSVDGEDGAKLSWIVLAGLGLSLGVSALDEHDRDDLKIIHATLLNGSSIYEAAYAAGNPPVYPALIHHVAGMIECGLIDLNRNYAALRRFADWIRAWPKDARPDLELAVYRLRLAAPSDLW
jgi:hypothetical protein